MVEIVGNPTIFIGVEEPVTLGFVFLSLVVRYFGVVAVLLLLMIGMIVSGKVFKQLERQQLVREKREREREALSDEAILAGEVPAASELPAEEAAGVEPEVAAAIAMAVHLELTRQARVGFAEVPGRDASSWAISGRISQLNSHTFR